MPKYLFFRYTFENILTRFSLSRDGSAEFPAPGASANQSKPREPDYQAETPLSPTDSFTAEFHHAFDSLEFPNIMDSSLSDAYQENAGMDEGGNIACSSTSMELLSRTSNPLSRASSQDSSQRDVDEVGIGSCSAIFNEIQTVFWTCALLVN